MKSKLTLICCVAASSLSAQIAPGDALKINSCYTGNKTLFMQNATLDDNVDAIVWTETNVPAQRWKAADADDGLFFLTNAYSDKRLTINSTRPKSGDKVILKSNNGEFCKWQLLPVANAAYPDAYYIRFSRLSMTGDSLYLELPDNTDGTAFTLQTKKTTADSLRQMWTVKAENILPNKVTPAFRDSVMRGWKERYFNWLKSETTGFWGEAEMLETILDAYETSGKQEYKTMFEDAYAHFVSGSGGWGVKGNGKDWRWNDYNDDIAWAVLASVRAYLMFGTHSNSSINYLTIAKNNYDWMYSRALLPGGTLRWCQSPSDNRGSNSCINGPAEVAACYLAIATGDESYYEKAKNLYAKQRQILYDPNTGKVSDSGSWNEAGTSFTVGNGWVSTYNQGTFLGAALMLYNHYGTEQYKTDAHKIVEWTRNDLCNTRGVVRVCGSGDDLQGFKGILIRYLRRYVVDLALPDKVEWLQRNALQAYNNRNSKGIIWTAWWEKAAENFVYSDGYNFTNAPFGSSTALSAAFNAPLSADLIIKDAFSTLEAENFDYVKGIFVERTNDSTAVVSNIYNDYYTTYSNVDFGGRTATGIEFLVHRKARTAQQIEIRLDSLAGTLLTTVDVPYTGTWATVTATVPNITGRRNICMVYKGASGKDMNLDTFRFTDGTDGIESRDVLPRINLYPNPATNYVQVLCPQESRLLVYNALGKEVASATAANGTVTLNVANYQSGVYFVSIITKTANYTIKFVKK
ncbi:MAG: carbohydrate-binding protein [Prevotella sp.]|jgi:predicted alpha-1,6-mannanase (GH76 family)|nr:carbohydrate-binding protein [Prevotella sp.]